jgi:hypothetical protein
MISFIILVVRDACILNVPDGSTRVREFLTLVTWDSIKQLPWRPATATLLIPLLAPLAFTSFYFLMQQGMTMGVTNMIGMVSAFVPAVLYGLVSRGERVRRWCTFNMVCPYFGMIDLRFDRMIRSYALYPLPV